MSKKGLPYNTYYKFQNLQLQIFDTGCIPVGDSENESSLYKCKFSLINTYLKEIHNYAFQQN